MFCSNCGSEVSEKSIACPKCGLSPKAERNHCTGCGAATVNPKQVICLQCGNLLQATSVKTKIHGSEKFNFFDTVTRKYSQFSGRARRSEFWIFMPIYYFLYINVFIFLRDTWADFGRIIVEAILECDVFTLAAYIIFQLDAPMILVFMTIPAIAVSVRRLHDIGRSGWFYLINFIPFAGPVILWTMCCYDGQPGDNEYGANPKGQ